MSGNEYDSDAVGKYLEMPSISIISIPIIDDDCYDTYYDDTDPFQDDNNNNYTTSVPNNDPEQFEYIVLTLKEVQGRFEPTVFSNSYVHHSTVPATCSICLKSQTNFQSLICNHAFCHDCWSQYIETKCHSHYCLSKFLDFLKDFSYALFHLDIECMKCDIRIPQKYFLWIFSMIILSIRCSFILEHLSSDNQKELYKKSVVKSMIKVSVDSRQRSSINKCH